MNQDEIIEMAKRVGLGFLDEPNWMYQDELEAFAKLVAAKERETIKQEQVIQTYSEKHNFQQEQGEPVACLHRLVDVTNPVVKSGYMCMDCGAVFRAYVELQQRKPLTDEEIEGLWHEDTSCDAPATLSEFKHTVRVAEAAHKIGVKK